MCLQQMLEGLCFRIYMYFLPLERRRRRVFSFNFTPRSERKSGEKNPVSCNCGVLNHHAICSQQTNAFQLVLSLRGNILLHSHA